MGGEKRLTFRFFRDRGGRLRAECVELDIRKPVESKEGHRYRFRRVFGKARIWQDYGSPDQVDMYRLQNASDGDVIHVTLK